MTPGNVFFTTAGTLRAPWRLLLFIVAFIASSVLLNVLAAPIIGGAFQLAGLRGQTVSSIVEMLAALLATWFALRYVEKKPWSEVGLHREAAQPRRIGLGLLIGTLAIALPIVILIAAGWLRRDAGTTEDWTGPIIRMTMLLLPAAFAEEIVTRGYIMTALKDAMSWRWAVIITSVAFGLLHLQNPGANAQSVAVVALAGVFLAAVRISTDSLYAAWAAHFAFNWVMVAIFHAPVSGLAFELPAYRYVDAGPDWATGGSWGPESGVPAALAMLAATGLLVLRRKRNVIPPVSAGSASNGDG